ncbi:MAG: TAXI family TRAP transporter solute-binding subunit, partial [Acidilobaceae archaeon]
MISGYHVEVIMLGTGATVPTSERLLPAILVRDTAGNRILLDTGEGAQVRLSQAGVSPTSIDLIAITHEHGDHVNGLPGLLQSMYINGRRKPLRIIAPTNISRVAYLIGTYTPEFPIIIYARADFPANTVPELMELIKSREVKLVLGGPAKGVEEYFTRALFTKYGINFDALKLPTAGSAAAAEAFIEGKYDVVIDSDSLISTAWQTLDVRAKGRVKVIKFTEDDLKYIVNYFGKGSWERFDIPVGLYEFIKENYTTLSLYTLIVIRSDLPNDLVYYITKLLCEKRDLIISSVGAYQNFDPSKGIITSGLPIHPGAEKYYKEKGYVKLVFSLTNERGE